MSDRNHLITTDNNFMNAVGLGAFTTGVLYDWVTENYGFNLGYLNIGSGLIDSLRYDFNNLSLTDIKNGKATSAFYIMDIMLGRNPHSGMAGSDEQYSIINYRQDGRNSRDSVFNFLADSSFSTWHYNIGSKDYDRASLELDNIDLRCGEECYEDLLISKIIKINDDVNDPSYLDNAQDLENSRYTLIRDIKTSQSGCVTWSAPTGTIIFYDGNGGECPQDVNFKLFLYDENTPKNIKPSIALPSTTIIGERKNEHGTVHKGRDTGDDNRFIPVTDDQPASKVGGELNLHYNEFTGKWESGTTTVLAVMETDIAAATPPDIGMISTPTDYDDPNSGFGPTWGKARPLSMKNANPWKWGPEWKYTKGCEENEKTKVLTVPVQNKLTVPFSSGQTVMLHDIGGIWQPMATASGETVDTVSTNVQNWDFMYLVSNAEYYFYSPSNLPVRYADYESAFYNYYYGLGTDVSIIDYDTNSYVQLTSWDFMGTGVGGLRENHALCNTQWQNGADGQVVADPLGNNLLGARTAPFFGCVFPDGYQTGSKYSMYTGILNENMTAYNGTNYINSILAGGTIFDTTGADSKNAQGNIFQNTSNTRVDQLPADIALNASPDSTLDVGAPLTILKNIETYFKPTANIRTNIETYLMDAASGIRYAWLAEADSNINSTFEFDPVSSEKIQFRPLKAEVYATFELDDDNSTPVNIRQEFAKEAWNTVTDSQSPIHTGVALRTIGVAPGSSNDGIWGAYGFEYNEDIASVTQMPDNDDAYPERYWERAWMPGNIPGGAVGIIGASCVVTANSTITFDTQNNLGMDDWFHVGNILNPNGNYDSSYGGLGTQYYSLNNTMLFARIFHHWPKKQTVYDPRFFVVHHFADGVGDSTINIKYYISDNEVTKTTYDATEDDPEYKMKHTAEQISYALTDFREPTLIGPVPSLYEEGILAAPGVTVYDNGDTPEWRDVDDWKLNVSSRGLLLPATGVSRNTVGVGQILIEEGGTGYANNNTFTTNGGAGSGVILSAIAEEGVITGFTVTNYGTDFSHEDFFTEQEVSDEEDVYAAATVKLTPISVNGTGLKAYVQYGQVYSTPIDIPKPAKATSNELLQLSPTPPIPHDDSQTRVAAMNETKTTVATISNASSDNKYDVFFHYHNDISHCFIKDWTGAFNPSNPEQMIELEISPV